MNSKLHNHIELLRNGRSFIEKMVETINKAESFILLHTYILSVDEVTGPIISALKRKAAEGVKTFVICDGIGSSDLSESSLLIFKNSDIHFKVFHPFFHLNHLGRRLHQKVLLVDNKYVILGGINLAKRFNLPEGQNPWLDYSVYLEGEEVKQVLSQIIFLYKKEFKDHRAFFYKLHHRVISQKTSEQLHIHTLVNDWMRYKNEIYRSYILGIKNAKKSITLMATYFIPGKKLLKELSKAAKRGVEVNLVFCSISDHPMISKVEQYFYGWYLQNGIHIYEWSESVMHGKLGIIDNSWVSIGSYNHNYISRYGNLEINFEIRDKNFSKVIATEFDEIISKCTKIDDIAYHTKYGFLDKVLHFLIYFLSNIITLLSLILIFKRSKDPEIV